MDKKYLIPIAIGVGVLVLVLIAAALFLNGNEEAAAGAGAAAAAALEVERRRRSRDKLAVVLEEHAKGAEGAQKRLGSLQDESTETMKANEEAVAGTSLSDLVDEENERDV